MKEMEGGKEIRNKKERNGEREDRKESGERRKGFRMGGRRMRLKDKMKEG